MGVITPVFIGSDFQQRSSYRQPFSLWTWKESSSTHCLSAILRCLERAHSLFNSQPIFCPSRHFIPTLELSSGPHTVTFWHISQPTPRQYQKIYCQCNPSPNSVKNKQTNKKWIPYLGLLNSTWTTNHASKMNIPLWHFFLFHTFILLWNVYATLQFNWLN